MKRRSRFAVSWYPGDREGVKEYFDEKLKPVKAIACVCPHAGWVFSGKTAGKVYSQLPITDTYILIGPNHSGAGSPGSVFAEGTWQMPMGDINVDADTAKIIIKNSNFLHEEYIAHKEEHSLEVQIPFIQYINPKAEIVPITISTESDEICRDIGHSVAEAVKRQPKKRIIVIASSDMSHYLTKDKARKDDFEAIEKIKALDPEGLLEVVSWKGISMCGAGPVASVLHASMELGAVEAKMANYSTSGEVTGDNESVVGYAGLIIK